MWARSVAKSSHFSIRMARCRELNECERWDFITSLDDEMLKGGATVSEWCALMVKECDLAFVGGVNIATVVVAVAAIETYLRAEYGLCQKARLADLIDRSPIDADLRDDIHKLRRYRNKWVHVSVPEDDKFASEQTEAIEE